MFYDLYDSNLTLPFSNFKPHNLPDFFLVLQVCFLKKNQQQKNLKKEDFQYHPIKISLIVHFHYLALPVTFSLVFPAELKGLSDEGKNVRVLQDGLCGGFPCTVPTTGVHPDHQGLTLHRAVAHPILQGGTVLQSVEGNHAIIVICCQKQDGRVGRTRVRSLRQIMERRIPGREGEKDWLEGKNVKNLLSGR